MSMPSTKGYAFIALLTVVLLGCNAVEPGFSQNVYNDEPTSLCLGGLRGVSGTAQVQGDSGRVAWGERAHAEWGMPQGSPSGTPITIEAWCYGEQGEELAYLKVTRGYREGMNASINTIAPKSDIDFAGTDYCLQAQPGDVQRGPLICVMSDF